MAHYGTSPGEIWTPIGQTSNQLILYHPPSHALSVQPHRPSLTSPTIPSSGSASHRALLLDYREESPIPTIQSTQTCPYCSQPLPFAGVPASDDVLEASVPVSQVGRSEYFQILERAHEGSRPSSPRTSGGRSGLRFGSTPLRDSPGIPGSLGKNGEDETFDEELPAKGYYERFFREERRLGMGAEGSVYLATHVIGGNILGSYAVKKIAVGTSKPYLLKILHEVRLLEALRHPNIIPYHHSWIDVTRFSSFGPPITALHVLMMYATAGNLDTFLLSRGYAAANGQEGGAAEGNEDISYRNLPNAERIKAFRRRKSSMAGSMKQEEKRGVLLLGQDEIAKLFGDVVEGLAFLHASSILHLDLKCSNVLLHWEDGKLIPKAMLSDFGTSEEMLRGHRERTGHTGTMEYMAPETLATDQNGHYRPSDSHGDMWSLGMILHKLLFLQLPYGDTADFDELHAKIMAFPGFIPSPDLILSCERRHIPRDLLLLLAKLIHVVPEARPTAEKVRAGIRGLNATNSSTKSRRQSSMLGSGLVSRFVKPFGGSNGTEAGTRINNPENGAVKSPIKPPGLSSPVRPILALPSPPLNSAASLPPSAIVIEDTAWRKFHIIVFTIKMMSLQPQLSRAVLHPGTVFVLVVSAILDLIFSSKDSWMVTFGLSVLHIAVFIRAYWVTS